jgi:NAD+ diphosphatase
MYYPRLSPAIMVLVRRHDTILLARSPHFKPGTYSALAGFVETGEALEDTIVREVFEEVGIMVGNLQYFGSQSWPFPHSLMLAFTADYVAGELRPDGVEIEDAKWFSPGNLPGLPHPKTLSRRLIDATVKRMQEEK